MRQLTVWHEKIFLKTTKNKNFFAGESVKYVLKLNVQRNIISANQKLGGAP
jgi:hypothetical protein